MRGAGGAEATLNGVDPTLPYCMLHSGVSGELARQKVSCKQLLYGKSDYQKGTSEDFLYLNSKTRLKAVKSK